MDCSLKSCSCCVELQHKNNLLEKEKQELVSKISILESQNRIIKNQLTQYKRKYIHSYENMSKDKKLFQKYSGIEHEQFINLYKFLNPGKNGESIKYHNSALFKKINILVNEEKSGPKPKLNAENQLCF